jgi:hypothetical protein
MARMVTEIINMISATAYWGIVCGGHVTILLFIGAVSLHLIHDRI